jgi:hypothetical protein
VACAAGRARPGIRSPGAARRRRDITASGATKIAGSLNFKDKYAPDFPRVTIREAQLGRVTSSAGLERMGLVAPPEAFAPLSPARPLSRGADKWPRHRAIATAADPTAAAPIA